MTTLATIDLDDNLILAGPEQNSPIAYSVRDTLGGSSVIQIDPRSSGALLILEALGGGGREQGKFCKHQIDALRPYWAAGVPVVLVHVAGTFTVVILEMPVIESDEREPLNDPNKKFYGQILLQEI